MKRTWMLAIAAGAVVAVLGVGAVWAQSSGQTTPGSSFLDRVAQKLGIDSPKLKQAIDDTRNEDIDAAVANGDLTQKQADALKQRAANGPEFFGEKGFGHAGGPGGFEFGFGLGKGMGIGDAAQQLADFLGISTDQLKTELQADNATLATVAEAHGKSRDDLKSFITNGVKAKLDQAVQNGDLTQKREDDALSMLNDNLDKLIDSKFIGRIAGKFEQHFRGPHRGDDNGNDDDGDDANPPSTAPAPQGGQGAQSFQF
jgi:hypothetical protein